VTATGRAATADEFETLLGGVIARAYALALRLTGNRTDAEDLVQEAGLLAFRAFHTFERGSNFGAWFSRILTNRYFSSYRKQRREAPTVSLDEAPALFIYGQAERLGLGEKYQDPAAELLSRLNAEQVSAALEALPEEFRVASTLYFMQDLSYEEIARALDIPVGTVRSRLHRGRRMLQKALWRVAEDEGIVAAMSGAEG
jgi:RNA polymerase sigma-70 factor (ECF subfamily)